MGPRWSVTKLCLSILIIKDGYLLFSAFMLTSTPSTIAALALPRLYCIIPICVKGICIRIYLHQWFKLNTFSRLPASQATIKAALIESEVAQRVYGGQAWYLSSLLHRKFFQNMNLPAVGQWVDGGRLLSLFILPPVFWGALILGKGIISLFAPFLLFPTYFLWFHDLRVIYLLKLKVNCVGEPNQP